MTSFEASPADVLTYLLLAALVYALPVVIGGGLILWGLRGQRARRKGRRVAVASGLLICLAPFLISGLLPVLEGAYERRTRSTERVEGVIRLPLDNFYLPPEDGVALPEGYELETVLAEGQSGPKPPGSLPPFLHTGYIYAAPDGARDFGRSVSVIQYLLPTGGAFEGCESEGSPCEEYATWDGHKVRVSWSPPPPSDVAVSVLLDGTTVLEATADLGDGEEGFDPRAFVRSLRPVPKAVFVEQAGQRRCFEYRSNSVNDVPVPPACRPAR